MRILAYGIAGDVVDECVRLAGTTTLKSLKKFIRGIIEIFGDEYLRRPTPDDIQRILPVNEARGFPGMIGSIDCMHWPWDKCQVAWQGQYTRGDQGVPTIILEAVASYDLWIWHAYFGVAGSNNDINVLNHSPAFNQFLEGQNPDVQFSVNGTSYNMGYYLADGIYPEWPREKVPASLYVSRVLLQMAKKPRSKSTVSKKQIKSKAKVRLSFNNIENLNLDAPVMSPAAAIIQEVPQTADSKGSKAMSDIVGIPPLDMDTIVEPGDLSDSADEDPDPRGNWTQVIGRKRSRSPVSTPKSPPLLQFTLEEVQPELEYWSTAVICYVLGGNPPRELLSGFVSRLWGKYKYDKISFLPNGAFFVHFPTMECKELVLKQGFPMFDNKPLVVKPWTETASLAKEKVKAVPIWIRLCGLSLKFWGESCLTKLGSLIGKFMSADGPTLDKTRLGYARLMIEVEVGQDLPNRLFFKDEKGVEQCVTVEYEWRPDVCSHCKGIGHSTDQCRKPVPGPGPQVPIVGQAPIPAPSKPVQTKVWRPVIRQKVVDKGKAPMHDEGISVSAAHPYGAPIIHNSNVLIPVSPIIQIVRQEHNPPVSPTKSYVEAVLSDTESPEKEGGGVNNNVHHSGGRVWVIWAPQMFNIQVIDSSAQQITSDVTEIATGNRFYFTVVYGFNEEASRRQLWSELQHIKDHILLPWCICGDFNVVLNFSETLGNPVTGEEIADFRQCVDYCDIMDIQAQGAFFTWNNKQDPSTRVFSRLDRCMVTEDWMRLYPDSYAYFMNEGLFDHSPIVCYRRKDAQPRKAPFKYFNMWGMDHEFKSIVQREWDKFVPGITMYQVIIKLKTLKQQLRLLNKNRYADIEKVAEVARVNLDAAQSQMHRQPGDHDIIQKEKEAAATFYSLQKARVSFLQQKAKSVWLAEGDENSAYFHRQIKARNVHNKVFQIKDVHGTQHCEPDAIEYAFLDYYQQLLGTSNPVHKVHVPTVRTGPDGYTSQFFKDSWEILGKDIFYAINNFFSTGKLLKQLNSTNITLISKIPNLSSVTDFRPIACCNTIYKCIAKLLCARLGKVLPDIVDCSQGGFIQGRNIVENVLICQDLVRLYRRKSASPRCLVKIDLRKAYDSVEWDFLHQMLLALKFPQKFIDLVMVCVTSTSYSLSLNGNTFGYFHGSRGLRQGDPLSPLLFTLCMEYLSRVLKVVGQQPDFHFHPLCGAIQLNHLLFADDLLLFSKGDELSII
ncbi:uncharacterized protein LOC141595329 [Silene latifolia]|uniref:uncharacterized protein LOC141595329 n=1 Tax=Silene latifolia TaxID=37657 RepID=UPI003D7862A8